MKPATRGKSFAIDRETSACPGGAWHCGLSEPPSGEACATLQRFLTTGEKLTASITTFHRMMALTACPPTGMAKNILLEPLDEAESRPDLAVFICKAEHACRLLTLDQYWDGIPLRVEVAGSLCGSAITYPLVAGNTILTFGDGTARRKQKYLTDAVFLNVATGKLGNLVLVIPKCSTVTSKFKIPAQV